MIRLLALTLALLAGPAAGATYQVFDHPARAIQTEDYGLRLDVIDEFFSLTDVSLTWTGGPQAFINGTVTDSGGDLWSYDYTFTEVTPTVDGWRSLGGFGTLSDISTTYELTGKQNSEGWAAAFGQHRGYLSVWGWLNVDGQYEPATDLLGRVVPIPPSLAMMFAAMLGMLIIKRRRV